MIMTKTETECANREAAPGFSLLLEGKMPKIHTLDALVLGSWLTSIDDKISKTSLNYLITDMVLRDASASEILHCNHWIHILHHLARSQQLQLRSLHTHPLHILARLQEVPLSCWEKLVSMLHGVLSLPWKKRTVFRSTKSDFMFTSWMSHFFANRHFQSQQIPT